MPKVIFKFDKEKDLWNNWDTVNYVSPWENSKGKKIPVLDKMCKGKKFEDCKEELEKFCKKLHNSYLIEDTKKSFQESWNKINDKFFEKLENITGNKFPFEKITAYLTTQLRCPYDENEGSFMVSVFSNIPSAMKTCGHELMHLDFHKNNWDETENKIGKEKTADLKEALTVLLNLEFRDLWIVKDKGKSSESQKKLRKFIEEEWKKEKDFEKLLEKCVTYLSS